MFRKHQDEFGEICYALRTGQSPQLKHIICSTTPGGGKSMLPLIAASQLIPGFAERICWVVPRRSLQSQAEAEFLKPRTRELLGHNHTVRRSTNEADPCRGLSGFVTTYQAIGMGNTHLREEFSRRRYILVLDEPHHLEEGGAWETALAPLVRRAALTVYMSGTLERGNRKRIAFLPYRETPDGEVIDLSNNPSTRTISYSRRDALLDKAVLPIHFELMDGTAQWIGRDGETYATTLSGAHKDTAEALYTALKTQFAVHLLDDCAAHWSTYRSTHPRSKLLVVTANIEDAKKYVDHLYAGGIKAAIATSDDSAQAARNIEHFKTVGKKRSLDALVTVAMAYEGLDVPAVTHIACLTHIRSKPWIEQMIARATRFDAEAGPWEEQMAYIYVPDDRNMCAIIAGMQDEQVAAIKQVRGDEEDFVLQMPPERGPAGERITITPVGSQGAGRRWNRIGHVAHTPSHGARETQRTPSQQEADLREKIQSYCKQVDLFFFDRKWGETNKRVVKTFGKPRTAMTLSELQRVMAWLEGNYPMGKSNGTKTRTQPVSSASRG
jgi:superfamily II DNA or RNA helicase